MQRTSGGFEDKVLSKLSRLDPDSIRHHFVKLLDQKQFFETIFDHLSEGVLVTGGRLNILFSNPIARRILQWPGGKRYVGEPLPTRCPEGPLRELFESLLGRPR